MCFDQASCNKNLQNAQAFSAANLLKLGLTIHGLEEGSDLRSVCGTIEPTAFAMHSKGGALWCLGPDGRLECPSSMPIPSGSAVSLRFPGVKHAIARLDMVDQAGRTLSKIACEPVDGETVYTLRKDETGAPGRRLLIRLYGSTPEENQERLRSLIEAEIATLVKSVEANERDAVHRMMMLGPVIDDVTRALSGPTAQSLQNASATVANALARGESLQKSFPCPDALASPSEAPALAPVICDEVRSVSIAIAPLQAALALSATDTANRAAILRDAKVRDVVASLTVRPPLSASATAAHCEQIYKLRWSRQSDAVRLLAQAQLPAEADVPVIRGAFGQAVPDKSAASPGQWAMVLSGVPVGQAVTFAVTQGPSLTVDAASVLQSFVPLLLKTQAGVLGIGSGSSGMVAPIPERASLVCKDTSAKILLDEALPSIASQETVTYLFGPLKQTNALTVAACAGQTCSGGADDKAVKNRVTLNPDETGTITLLADASLGFGVYDWAGGRVGGFVAQNPPSFQPASGPSGPDQLFRLQQSIDPRNVLTTSLLLAYRFKDNWTVGAGPSLLVGTGGGLLSQWSLHFGTRIAKSLYATFGPSVRLVSLPVGGTYRVGDMVSVPKPSGGGNATPPPLQTYFAPLLQLDVGIALDLAGLGSAGKDVVSAFGGGK